MLKSPTIFTPSDAYYPKCGTSTIYSVADMQQPSLLAASICWSQESRLLLIRCVLGICNLDLWSLQNIEISSKTSSKSNLVTVRHWDRNLHFARSSGRRSIQDYSNSYIQGLYLPAVLHEDLMGMHDLES